MKQLTFSLPEQILASINMDSEEVLNSMKKEYAVKLFREGKLTLNQSAQFCDMNIFDFTAILSLTNVPVINYSAEDLENEINQF